MKIEPYFSFSDIEIGIRHEIDIYWRRKPLLFPVYMAKLQGKSRPEFGRPEVNFSFPCELLHVYSMFSLQIWNSNETYFRFMQFKRGGLDFNFVLNFNRLPNLGQKEKSTHPPLPDPSTMKSGILFVLWNIAWCSLVCGTCTWNWITVYDTIPAANSASQRSLSTSGHRHRSPFHGREP